MKMQEPTRSKEGIQRIQIGLSGLAGVVLLIGLANIVVDNARRDAEQEKMAEAGPSNETAPPAIVPEEKPKEPLAELGVAPSSDSAAPPVVADLQPDPNLKEPMDRPPPVAPTLPPDQRQSAPQP